MDRTVDAVVIGAGHNGLVSAIRLAQKGWKVLVVEAAAVAGGSAKTAELTLPGYRHDLYATNVGLFLVSQFYRQNQAALQAAGFEPVVAKSS
ncbi:MAG: FAD-dependent oxidoreductase, partial [Sinobacteraceae bacterium]|nr:FAD-dependent oxidoreductase [Nevskiaceae bacterium]